MLSLWYPHAHLPHHLCMVLKRSTPVFASHILKRNAFQAISVNKIEYRWSNHVGMCLRWHTVYVTALDRIDMTENRDCNILIELISNYPDLIYTLTSQSIKPNLVANPIDGNYIKNWKINEFLPISFFIKSTDSTTYSGFPKIHIRIISQNASSLSFFNYSPCYSLSSPVYI